MAMTKHDFSVVIHFDASWISSTGPGAREWISSIVIFGFKPTLLFIILLQSNDDDDHKYFFRINDSQNGWYNRLLTGHSIRHKPSQFEIFFFNKVQIFSHKAYYCLYLRRIRFPLNHILVDEQHWFRQSLSITSCNLALTSYIYIYNSFRKHKQVDVIYTKFSKAFNHVNHNLFLKHWNT
jgi:hypothetical protein